MLVITSMDHLAYYVSNLAGVLLNGFPAHDDQPPPRVGDLAILEVVTISPSLPSPLNNFKQEFLEKSLFRFIAT